MILLKVSKTKENFDLQKSIQVKIGAKLLKDPFNERDHLAIIDDLNEKHLTCDPIKVLLGSLVKKIYLEIEI